MVWIIWYGDGSFFSSSMGEWENAPRENVQVIIKYQNPDTRKTRIAISGRDFYDFDGKRFYKSDDISKLPGNSIKYGKYLGDPKDKTKKEFIALLNKAKDTSWL